MNKRKLYDLVINALIFNGLYVNIRRFGGPLRLCFGYSVSILKGKFSEDLHISWINKEWTIHKYDS